MTQAERKQNWWYGGAVLGGIAAVMTPAIMLAAGGTGGGFDSVVHVIEARYHVHATRIPFMSLVSGIAGLSTHGGVHNLHVAEIEHLNEPVDGAELNALVEQHVGQSWQRMIRETSRGGGEQTLIYVRAEGDHIGMLVVDLDGHEMDLVQMSMNPDRLSEEISQHSHHGKHSDDESENKNKKDESDSD